MSRPKGSKNKPKLVEIVKQEILTKPVKQRRSKKEKYAKMPAPVVNINTPTSYNVDVSSTIKELKAEPGEDKKKRVRRNKAQLAQAKQLAENELVITDKRKSQKSVIASSKKLENGQLLFTFDIYNVYKVDEHNFSLTIGNKERQVFLGYYPISLDGFRTVVEAIAVRLITKVDDKSYRGLISADSVLKGLGQFRVFLDTNFKA